MADPNVSERRIRPIQDAVATGNWKQALQQCDKWLKKGEKSDKFLALKAYILVNQPDKTLQEKGYAETLQLCHRTPAITDLDAIHQLQDALKDLSLHDAEGPKLWERAVAVSPSDKDLLMTWLNRSIADSNWLGAQKAAMALRKAFPKERQYDFWNILLCHLVHQDQMISEKERTLFGTLAYRLVSKAAEMVPTDQEQLLSSGKAITTPEELYLLVHIYIASGHVSEVVELLQSPILGLESRVGKQDPQLWLSLLLQTLNIAENWEAAFSICQRLLESSEHQNDDRVWDLLLTSQQKCDSIKTEQLLQVFNNVQTEETKPIRSATLAKLKFFQLGSRSSNESSTSLLDTCLQYYQAYGSKVFSFQDLRKPLQALDGQKLASFQSALKSEIDENPTNLIRLFQLKVEYAVGVNSVKDLVKLSRTSLELYHSSLSQDPVCPEAALLAAMALLRVSELSNKQEITLQVVMLIQTCSTRFPDYYQFSVLLVQCYCHLGLFSQAMEVFVKLDVKNMQWETVGHMILTRVSSLHPHQAGSKESALNPAGAVDAGMTMLEKADQALVRSIREGLKHGSYSSIINCVEMRQDNVHSINKQLFAIEDRRIERILGSTSENILENRPESLIDKRDFSFLPKYSELDTKMYQKLRCGPLPKEFWIDVMAQADQLWAYFKHDLSTSTTSQTTIVSHIYGNLKKSFDRTQRSKNDCLEELTPAERNMFECVTGITQLLFAHIDKSTPTATDVGSPVQNIEAMLSQLHQQAKERTNPTSLSDVATDSATSFGNATSISSSVQILVPSWSYLHTSYQQLDMLQGLSLFLAWSGKQSSSKSKSRSKQPKSSTSAILPSKEQITTFQNQIKSLTAAIHESARTLKQEINKPGVLSALVDLALHRQSEVTDGDDGDEELNGIVEKICDDEGALEELCGRVKDSWEDALDGILSVKVKV